MLNNAGTNLGIHFWPFSAICRTEPNYAESFFLHNCAAAP